MWECNGRWLPEQTGVEEPGQGPRLFCHMMSMGEARSHCPWASPVCAGAEAHVGTRTYLPRELPCLSQSGPSICVLPQGAQDTGSWGPCPPAALAKRETLSFQVLDT